MTPVEFERQFTRLTEHFHLPTDASRDTIAVDWFKAVQHYHVDALERGVTELIRTHDSPFWPVLKLLLDAIKSRMAGMERTRGACEACGGSTWVDAMPWKFHGRVYTGFRRCPDCGVPPPQLAGTNTNRQELSASEYQAWRAGTLEEPPMPLSVANRAALEALQHIDPKRGRMRHAIAGAPKARGDAA